MIRLICLAEAAIFIGACVAFSPARAESVVNIGNGGDGSTSVEIADGREQGALAVITFRNRAVNGAADDGNYTLTLGTLEVRVSFRWNTNAAGDDEISITAPDGLLCYIEATHEYGDTCTLTAPEGTERLAYIQAPVS